MMTRGGRPAGPAFSGHFRSRNLLSRRHKYFPKTLWRFCHLYSSVSFVNAIQKKQLWHHTFASSLFSATASLAVEPVG